MLLAVLPVGLLIAGMAAWGTLFLWISNIPLAPVRAAMAGLLAIGTLTWFAFVKRRRPTLAACLVVFAALVGWYHLIRPSNDRLWAPEVAVLPTATVNGNLIEIGNIRNFDYRTATDFTPRYYDKTFALDELRSADLISVHWGDPAIAHVFVSFWFKGDDCIAFSIEMRKETGEAGFMLRSFFRKYELIYIAADERDVIRVRTNYRSRRDEVYVYCTRVPTEDLRKLFLAYAAKIDELTRRPKCYNTIQDNCTTGVLTRGRAAYKGRGQYNWRVLLSGYTAEYAYGLVMFDTNMPFAELRERCHINARAELADQAHDFSLLIREGVPKPKPYTLEEFENPRREGA